MSVKFSVWRPLAPTEVARLPEGPGVFELATLVRTILFIGAAPEGFTAALSDDIPIPPHVHAGRLYFRFYPTDHPEKVHADLLNEYRQRHGGALPPAQSKPPSPLRPLRHLKAV